MTAKFCFVHSSGLCSFYIICNVGRLCPGKIEVQRKEDRAVCDPGGDFCSGNCFGYPTVFTFFKNRDHEYHMVCAYPFLCIAFWSLSDVDIFRAGGSYRIAGSG